mgnify:CR=1 FL=1
MRIVSVLFGMVSCVALQAGCAHSQQVISNNFGSHEASPEEGECELVKSEPKVGGKVSEEHLKLATQFNESVMRREVRFDKVFGAEFLDSKRDLYDLLAEGRLSYIRERGDMVELFYEVCDGLIRVEIRGDETIASFLIQ